MHHRQLPRVIELKAGDALLVGPGSGRSQFLELAAIDESLQDVLLGIVVVVKISDMRWRNWAGSRHSF
jgi:hypothetical protein